MTETKLWLLRLEANPTLSGLAVTHIVLLAHWIGLAIAENTKCRVALEGGKIGGNLLEIELAVVASHTRETSEFNVFGRFSQGLCESCSRMSSKPS